MNRGSVFPVRQGWGQSVSKVNNCGWVFVVRSVKDGMPELPGGPGILNPVYRERFLPGGGRGAFRWCALALVGWRCCCGAFGSAVFSVGAAGKVIVGPVFPVSGKVRFHRNWFGRVVDWGVVQFRLVWLTRTPDVFRYVM